MTARVALVTGAGSGIGLSVAERLAAQGHVVVLVGRGVPALERARAACERVGGSAMVVPADVRDAEAVRSAFETAASLGRLDAVVHSAGVLTYGRFEDVPAEVFEAAIDTTLLGTSRVFREALRIFRSSGGGRFVVVGSVLGKVVVPEMSSYVTAKWGLHGLVRTLQVEHRGDPDVEISLVSPGGVDTPIYRSSGTFSGRHGRPPEPVAGPDKAADAVMACLERPRREVDLTWTNHVIVLGSRLLPWLYDAAVGPLASRVAQQPGSGVEPTAGNVLEPRDVPPEADDPPGSLPVRRTVAAPADRVWEVLADPARLQQWLPGARVHESEDGRHLVLGAEGAAGPTRVRVEVEPDDGPSCTVTIRQDVVDGPGRVVPRLARQGAVVVRSTLALRRLADLAEAPQRDLGSA